MWSLIIYVYAGVLSRGDSVAITTLPNLFLSQAVCEKAGIKAKSLVNNSLKEYRYVCISTD